MATNPINTNPPVIVKEDGALEQLAWEIKAAMEAGETSANQAMERFRQAGVLLCTAKKRVTHGQWLVWLKKNFPKSYREASRYMKLAAEWSKLDTVSNLSDAMKILTQDIPIESVAPIKQRFCRDCRINGPKKGCIACHELRVQEEAHAPTGPREAGDETEPGGEWGPKPPKTASANGKPKFEWKSIERPLSELVRQIDALGNTFACKEDEETNRIRDLLSQALVGLKAIYKRVTRQKAPE